MAPKSSAHDSLNNLFANRFRNLIRKLHTSCGVDAHSLATALFPSSLILFNHVAVSLVGLPRLPLAIRTTVRN
jgi:hypothetical protein